MGSDCCKESKQDEKVTEEVGATEITNADDAPEKDYQAAYRRAETKNNANGADKQKRYSQRKEMQRNLRRTCSKSTRRLVR